MIALWIRLCQHPSHRTAWRFSGETLTTRGSFKRNKGCDFSRGRNVSYYLICVGCILAFNGVTLHVWRSSGEIYSVTRTDGKDSFKGPLTHFRGRPLGLFSPVAAFCERDQRQKKKSLINMQTLSVWHSNHLGKNWARRVTNLKGRSHIATSWHYTIHSSANEWATISLPSRPIRNRDGRTVMGGSVSHGLGLFRKAPPPPQAHLGLAPRKSLSRFAKYYPPAGLLIYKTKMLMTSLERQKNVR